MSESGQTPVRGYRLMRGNSAGLETSAYGFLSGRTRKSNHCTSKWTDERVEILKTEWATGKSASQIANILGGVTRNSVIGKVHRLGLVGRSEASVPRRLAPVAPSKPRAIRGGFVLPTHGVGNPIENALLAATQNALAQERLEPTDTVNCAPKIWTDRRPNECNWVVSGRGADSMACCNRVHARGWCREHYNVGTVPVKAGEKELARALRKYL